MNIAYLVLAHNNPQHLSRLISKLSTENCKFFIHIDKKSDIDQFRDIKANNIVFCQDRVAVYWADFTQIDAILTLMNAAIEDTSPFDYLVLLSGVDYPMQSSHYIELYLSKHKGTEFINAIEMPSVAYNKPLSRLTHYKLRNSDTKLFNAWQSLKLMLGFISKSRDYQSVFKQLKPYAGSTWWALTYNSAKYALDFLNENSVFKEFYKNTDCPDESILQTVIANSPYKQNIKTNLTYTDWSSRKASPDPISEKHLPLFAQKKIPHKLNSSIETEYLFARKFSDKTSALLDKIDQLIDSKTNSA